MRVLAVVLGHVDELLGLAGGADGGLDHRLRRADEGDHRAVGGLARVDVEEFDALDGFDLVGDLPDDGQVAAFAEIRDAFDESVLHRISLCRSCYCRRFKSKNQRGSGNNQVLTQKAQFGFRFPRSGMNARLDNVAR